MKIIPYGIECVSRKPLRGQRLRKWFRAELDGWVQLPWTVVALLVLLAALLVALNRHLDSQLKQMDQDLTRMEQGGVE